MLDDKEKKSQAENLSPEEKDVASTEGAAEPNPEPSAEATALQEEVGAAQNTTSDDVPTPDPEAPQPSPEPTDLADHVADQPELASKSSTAPTPEKASDKEEASPAVEEKPVVEKPVETVAEKKPIEAVKEEEEELNYSDLSLEELIVQFQKEINGEIPKIKKKVEEIKSNFTKKFGKLRQEKKEAFLEAGGNELDFEYVNPLKSTFNDLLFEYKTKRERYYNEIEREQKENLSKRLALIEELKHLIDHASPETMYTDFRVLQDRWKVIGKIPRAKYNDVWRTYHHHVERFYDLLHLRNDFRDLDFKHNLEEKIKLTEKAEELAEKEDLNEAFRELQVLHKLWKEDIGPVAREFREEIWERFSNATKKIHERRHELQKNLESKFEANIATKRAVIEKIGALVSEQAKESHKFWQQKIKELEALRQEFFAIGKVPRAVSDEIWNEFKSVTREFNKRKNVFYKNIKREQHQNLAKKQALVQRAEELKDSEDWDLTTEIMKQIQAEWKNVGHVPRKYSDKLWKQFKAACNHYFDRLHREEDEEGKEHIEAFNRKKEMLERVKNDKGEVSMDSINALTNEWHALGQLPQNMRHIEAKFAKVINAMYGKLDLDEQEVAMLKFRNVIDAYLADNNYRKIDNEKIFVRKKIDEITKEIQQLETNIGFFSNANADNPLFKGVNDTIEKYNAQLEIWKTKQDYLSRLAY